MLGASFIVSQITEDSAQHSHAKYPLMSQVILMCYIGECHLNVFTGTTLLTAPCNCFECVTQHEIQE